MSDNLLRGDGGLVNASNAPSAEPRPLDHVAEALKLRGMTEESVTTQRAEMLLAQAQVHATLAVAEQQRRIADWLESWPLAHDESPVVSVNGVS